MGEGPAERRQDGERSLWERIRALLGAGNVGDAVRLRRMLRLVEDDPRLPPPRSPTPLPKNESALRRMLGIPKVGDELPEVHRYLVELLGDRELLSAIARLPLPPPAEKPPSDSLRKWCPEMPLSWHGIHVVLNLAQTVVLDALVAPYRAGKADRTVASLHLQQQIAAAYYDQRSRTKPPQVKYPITELRKKLPGVNILCSTRRSDPAHPFTDYELILE